VFVVSFATLIVSGAYFSSNQILTGTITLGELDFRVLNNLSQVVTQEPGLFMPDEVVANAITILNARDDAGLNTSGLTDFYLRIRPVFTIGSEAKLELLHIELNNPLYWVAGSDGFLYYKRKVGVGESVIFNDYFTLSYLIDNAYQNAPVYLGVEVDVVQTGANAYLSAWETAPQEWITIIEQ
jgi:hypothetical protein